MSTNRPIAAPSSVRDARRADISCRIVLSALVDVSEATGHREEAERYRAALAATEAATRPSGAAPSSAATDPFTDVPVAR